MQRRLAKPACVSAFMYKSTNRWVSVRHLIKRYDFISANKSPAALGHRILINAAARKNCNRS
jgi:hypothetical protein